MNYSEKLKSPKWQKKRLEILNRDNFKCCLCGDEKTELHVHHLKYTGANPENAPNKDLETLCKDCHSAKTFFPSKEKIIKAQKKNNVIVAILEDKTIVVFFKEDCGNFKYLLGFLEKGFLLNMVNEFEKEFWNKESEVKDGRR